MRKRILNRYARTDAGDVIVDVSAPRIQDLYNDFDKTAPFLRKDLDQDLADYLTDCTREIGRTPFIIRITLGTLPNDGTAARVKRSIQNYFLYLRELKRRKVRRMARTSLILLLIGIGVLALAVSVNQRIGKTSGVMAHVFAEGLTVAAWVSLWEALATFLIQWAPVRSQIKLFRRLADAQVYCRAEGTDAQPDHYRRSCAGT